MYLVEIETYDGHDYDTWFEECEDIEEATKYIVKTIADGDKFRNIYEAKEVEVDITKEMINAEKHRRLEVREAKKKKDKIKSQLAEKATYRRLKKKYEEK